jgi:peptidoglycan hydrolase CwlO-like protein
MTQPAPALEQPRRFIDFQLSLQAVISGAVVVATFMVWMGWQAAQQTNISLQTQASVIKLEKRFDDKDAKIEDMREKMSDQKSDFNSLKLRIEILERARK